MPKHNHQNPIAIDRDFWQRVDYLTTAMKNLVERSSPPEIRSILGWHPFLMVATRATQTIYQSISYLSADSPPEPLRKLEFGLTTSPLIRSLADLLFNIVFIRERPRSRISRFNRAGWRETKEMVSQLEARYGSNPDWREKLMRLNSGLEDLRIAYRIGKQKARNPKNLPKWPIPSAMLREEKFRSRTRQFLEHITLWYRELSQDHHMTGGGIIRVYGKLLLEPTDDERETILRRLKTNNVFLAVALVLAIETEINDIGNLGHTQKLAYLWRIMVSNRPEAQDIFRLRYRKMLPR